MEALIVFTANFESTWSDHFAVNLSIVFSNDQRLIRLDLVFNRFGYVATHVSDTVLAIDKAVYLLHIIAPKFFAVSAFFFFVHEIHGDCRVVIVNCARMRFTSPERRHIRNKRFRSHLVALVVSLGNGICTLGFYDGIRIRQINIQTSCQVHFNRLLLFVFMY